MAGFPFTWEQAAGAFVALALLLLWGARRRLLQAFGRKADRLFRTALAGFLLCGAVVCGWYVAAGMEVLSALLFFGLVFCFVLTYMRIRAEAGLPSNWCHPLNEAIMLPIYIGGSKVFVKPENPANFALLCSAAFLTRGYFPYLAAYQIKGLKLGREAGVPPGRMALVLALGAVLGLAVGLWVHLATAYEYGANVLEGGTTQGGLRVSLYLQWHRRLVEHTSSPRPSDLRRAVAACWGFSLAFALWLLRHVPPRFPLHPLGLCMGLIMGDMSWASFLLVWTAKSLILRLGGVRLYRRTVPFFLGLAFGHLAAAGLIWGLVAPFGGEAFRRYVVWF